MNTELFLNMQELSESDCETIFGSGSRNATIEECFSVSDGPLTHRPHKPKGPNKNI